MRAAQHSARLTRGEEKKKIHKNEFTSWTQCRLVFFFKTIFKPLSTNVRRSCIGRDTFFSKKYKIMYIKRPLMLSLLWRKKERQAKSQDCWLWYDSIISFARLSRARAGRQLSRLIRMYWRMSSTAEEMKIKVEISTFSSSYFFVDFHDSDRWMQSLKRAVLQSSSRFDSQLALIIPFSRSSLASFSVGADQPRLWPRHFCISRCWGENRVTANII